MTVNAVGCVFDSHLGEVKYFIFSFSHSGNEANGGVEFRHSTRDAFRILREVMKGNVLIGTECLNTSLPGSL